MRKAMAKSMGVDALDKYGAPWKAGAIAKGVPADVASDVWEDLCGFGAYAFNKSHATAYGLVSYWCCWLKAHHPFEFAAATLSHESDPERKLTLLREMLAEGYDYVPVDPDRSTLKWGIGEKDGKPALIGPLLSVRGMGPKLAQQILHARAMGEAMPDRAVKLLANPVTDIDSLWPIKDAFSRIMPDPSERNIHTPSEPISGVNPTANWDDVLVFCTIASMKVVDENEPGRVAKRNGQVFKDGYTTSLNLQLTDDTDTIFAKVGRKEFEKIGKEIMDRGRCRKCLYAIKGTVPPGDFKMILVKQARWIGDIEETHTP